MSNQSLHSIIQNLPEHLRTDILEATDVSYLTSLKQSYLKDPDVIAVIDARIENLTYLVL
ncbi:hypothetical protein OOZ35_00350 [Mesoflavibacter profundi]|uniref:F-box domain-containing protein n=1 Tax=Mesoflavibacter profundi TaxID=2708110 RepID=A0ABT4RVZ0_9FLAO|nr:hypothetical protein [Mesoflavibacter profundi]MDA0175875.1 hypothetical protein [Mesoflavibacter profundi]MDA0175922.1 hypothetical protein [Mesoflavibacter profundi]MDA0175936.1 hypothetical protein [Mesoflavibacter profundi]